jgi:RHS repeat-associated protein
VVRFQLGNHLGSSILEVDAGGSVISYEEYHPYGTTAYHSGTGTAEVSLKRYRYTGKERDEETGLYYHGARYYAPWLGRWTSADPAGVTLWSAFTYVRDNPVRYLDPDGKDENDPQQSIAGVGFRFDVTYVLHASKVVPQIPFLGLVVRKSQYQGKGAVEPYPADWGFIATDPKSRLTLAEHMLAQHVMGPDPHQRPSPFISVSERPFGSSNHEGVPFWINIKDAKEAGAVFYSHEEVLAAMEDLAKSDPGRWGPRVDMWKAAQPKEREAAFSGYIPPSAVETAGVQVAKGIGTGLAAVGVVTTTIDLTGAAFESVATDSPTALLVEATKQTGAWAAGSVGAEAGAAIGAVGGPIGSAVGGILGGMITGTAGYTGADMLTQGIERKAPPSIKDVPRAAVNFAKSASQAQEGVADPQTERARDTEGLPSWTDHIGPMLRSLF